MSHQKGHFWIGICGPTAFFGSHEFFSFPSTVRSTSHSHLWRLRSPGLDELPLASTETTLPPPKPTKAPLSLGRVGVCGSAKCCGEICRGQFSFGGGAKLFRLRRFAFAKTLQQVKKLYQPESGKGGWETQQRGKHTIRPPPHKRFWTPPTYDTLPPPPPSVQCSCPVIFSIGGNGHRADKSHFLSQARERHININFFVRLVLGRPRVCPGDFTGFVLGTNPVKTSDKPGFSPYFHSGSPISPGLSLDKPGLSLGQSRGRRAAQKVYVKKVYVPFSLAIVASKTGSGGRAL